MRIESESCVDERVCCCPSLLYIKTGSQIEVRDWEDGWVEESIFLEEYEVEGS